MEEKANLIYPIIVAEIWSQPQDKASLSDLFTCMSYLRCTPANKLAVTLAQILFPTKSSALSKSILLHLDPSGLADVNDVDDALDKVNTDVMAVMLYYSIKFFGDSSTIKSEDNLGPLHPSFRPLGDLKEFDDISKTFSKVGGNFGLGLTGSIGFQFGIKLAALLVLEVHTYTHHTYIHTPFQLCGPRRTRA